MKSDPGHIAVQDVGHAIIGRLLGVWVANVIRKDSSMRHLIQAGLTALVCALTTVSAAGAAPQREFAVCLQQAMSVYPGVDPREDFVGSMHSSASRFGVYLDACMRARGFVDKPWVDARCLDARNIENEAFCFVPDDDER